MNWNPDLADHIMACSNTAALQQREASQDMSREEEAQQLADDNERLRTEANSIVDEDFFAFEVICDIDNNWFRQVGIASLSEHDDISTQAEIGRKILHAIRDAAIRIARKELGL